MINLEDEVKVSQLPSASTTNDTDVVMIIQDGYNKKASVSELNKKTRQVIGSAVDTYDNTRTYSKDELTVHEGYIYKSNADISTAEEWTPAHWTQISLLDLIDLVNTKVNAMPEWQEVDSW